MPSFSYFTALPEEIQYQILDSCSSQTLAVVLSTSHKLNSLTSQVLSSRLSALCGLPKSTQLCYATDLTPETPQGPFGFVLKAYSPEDLSRTSVHWFDTEYSENNHFSDFNCNFAHSYCSQPSTAHNSDEDMHASLPPRKHKITPVYQKKHHTELVPQTKFRVKSHIKSSTYGSRTSRRGQSRLSELLSIEQQENQHIEHEIATLDVLEGDAFGQLVIELNATPIDYSLTNTTKIIQKTCRISPDWALDHEYAIHNHELTLHIQVVKDNGSTPLKNEFGENFDRFHIVLTDIVVNMAYLLHQLENTQLIA